jgi:hypothetical protein
VSLRRFRMVVNAFCCDGVSVSIVVISVPFSRVAPESSGRPATGTHGRSRRLDEHDSVNVVCKSDQTLFSAVVRCAPRLSGRASYRGLLWGEAESRLPHYSHCTKTGGECQAKRCVVACIHAGLTRVALHCIQPRISNRIHRRRMPRSPRRLYVPARAGTHRDVREVLVRLGR